VFVRRKLLAQIATELVQVLLANKNIRLIIIHGAGAAGHQLANDIEVAIKKPVVPEYVPEHAKKIGEFIVKEAMLKEQYDNGLSILKKPGINELF